MTRPILMLMETGKYKNFIMKSGQYDSNKSKLYSRISQEQIKF